MQLFGDKTVSVFDLWTLEHFLAGLAGAWLVRKIGESYFPEIFKTQNLSKQFLILAALIALPMTLLWECIEFYLEAGYTHNDGITYWFQGVEYWANRIIGDPVITLAGGYLGLRYPHLIIPTRFVSLAWVALHVFFFPHSMYLQQFIEK